MCEVDRISQEILDKMKTLRLTLVCLLISRDRRSHRAKRIVSLQSNWSCLSIAKVWRPEKKQATTA